jgi:hypothetical protein
LSIHKLARGVYWAAATKDGYPQAYAVNAAGDEIKRLTVKNFTWKRAEAVIEFLWRFLDMKDPETVPGTVLPMYALPEPTHPVRDPYDPYAVHGVPGNLRTPW